MPKLHELLAVERSLKTQAEATRADLTSTFQKKQHHFAEKLVSYRPYGENEQTVVESQLDLQTTVPRELKWLSGYLVKSLNAAYQVAEANTAARADVVLEDGTILLAGVPATALLELEKRAQELQTFIKVIPTLDPAKGFTPAPAKGAGIFEARPDRKTRTKKVNKVLTLAPATEKHPAQVQVVAEDVPVGEITALEWSGLITTAAKGDMLSRAEDFSRAVKKALSRANEQLMPAVAGTLGDTVIGFVFGL